MKVKLNTQMVGTNINFEANKTYDFSESHGQSLIDAGIGEKVSEPKTQKKKTTKKVTKK